MAACSYCHKPSGLPLKFTHSCPACLTHDTIQSSSAQHLLLLSQLPIKCNGYPQCGHTPKPYNKH